MNRFAIQQNDTGVNLFEVFGDLAAALYHFRQALAAKLESEKRLLTSSEKNDHTSLHSPVNDADNDDKPTGDIEVLQMQDFRPNEDFRPNDVRINRNTSQFEVCSCETTGACKRSS